MCHTIDFSYIDSFFILKLRFNLIYFYPNLKITSKGDRKIIKRETKK